MTIAWATDVHFDFVGDGVFETFCRDVHDSGAGALLLGGDIAVAPTVEGFLRDIADAVGMPVYFVLGNHDYYQGSIAEVEAMATALATPDLQWLERAGPVALSGATALAGVGGWGDARLGNADTTQLVLNDFVLIEELRRAFGLEGGSGSRAELQALLRELADGAAEALRRQLEAAVVTRSRVVVLTHVPPFREAAWYEGVESDPDYLPYFACAATGDVIRAAAEAHSDCEFTVFCGHTHGGGEARILDNLTVLTAPAEYGKPRFRTLDV